MIIPEGLEVQFGWALRSCRQEGYEHSQLWTEASQGARAYRVQLVISGRLASLVNNELLYLRTGDLACIPPVLKPEIRTERCLERCEYITAGFRVLLFGSVDITKLLNRASVWRPDAFRLDTLTALLHVLSRLPSPPSLSETLVRDGAIRTVIGLCWETLGTECLAEDMQSLAPKWLRLVLQEIRHNPGISVNELERLTGYRHSQFNRLFQQYFGYSPKAYLQRYRLETAKRLLTVTDMKITEIAYHLGFASVSDFTRFFRQVCLEPPTEFRRVAHATGTDLRSTCVDV